MKTCKFAFVTIILSAYILVGNAQIFPLYETSKHCLFLQSKLNLSTELVYFNKGGKLEKNLDRLDGFSIGPNLTMLNNNKYVMKLYFYRTGLKGRPVSVDSIMYIDLYFERMADTEHFYLNIIKFKPGYKIVTIPSKLIQKVAVNICCMGSPVNINNKITWPPVPAFDITEIVFSESKQQ